MTARHATFSNPGYEIGDLVAMCSNRRHALDTSAVQARCELVSRVFHQLALRHGTIADELQRLDQTPPKTAAPSRPHLVRLDTAGHIDDALILAARRAQERLVDAFRCVLAAFGDGPVGDTLSRLAAGAEESLSVLADLRAVHTG